MMLFNLCGRIILLFIFLVCNHSVAAERDIGNHIELPPAQLEQLELDNFKLLGLVKLDQTAGQDYPLMEFSGLAWDHDQETLIILSDRGFLIHTKPIFDGDRLLDLKLLSYHFLKTKNGKKLVHAFADSEGLALLNSNNNIKGDTELIVSFERNPRIIQYTSSGEYISRHTLNNKLDDIQNYSGANKALEAITLHKDYKIITGPERPLKNSKSNLLSLHSLKSDTWQFSPENENHGSLVGLTTLPDGRLIALERIYFNIFAGVSNAIHLITLSPDDLQIQKVSKLNPSASYFNDNFEGISWHKANRFFIISDDNDSPLQKTLLVYFEIPGLEIKSE